ncbi:hypothetical protein KHS38_15230 [Mucilaginibacter sp. Bleaf8]|uniref:hypothetical protein n=1 Tax=Mucilaginibacter sp. Bleaf8 TaxID=2834430 RepID=UPI001BCACA54|nr:hypothetical protein [Mucilaginibacter sp. Bleaf8]MBS7565760.1 hypothetical protein [Mucilaginibacter sp. Bleaf8]
MALDFYNLQDTKLNHRLFSLNDADLEAIESILFEYKRATGITLDRYGNTRLYQDHVSLIIKLLESTATELPQYSQQSKHLALIISKFEQAEDDLLAIGD